MFQFRRRVIGIGWGLVVAAALVFGAREALASARVESCEDCVPEVTNCEQCCIDWNFEHGMCPWAGGYCLCW